MLAKDIQKRTRAGIDKDGRRFAPLALSTQADKRRRGQPTNSNLTDSGQMLDSLAGFGKKGQIRVGFKSEAAATKAGYAEQGASNRPKRSFLGIAGGELNKLKRLILQSFFKG